MSNRRFHSPQHFLSTSQQSITQKGITFSAMSSLSSIADLKPFKSMWKIKVKIIRLWRQYSAAGGLTIEMVLIDSNGDKIHASVKKDLVNQFDPFLNEGDSRVLINFAVSHSTGSYRTTRHAYKIGFLFTTRVRQCEGLPAELNGFEPINYKDLIDGNFDTDYLIDVIGQIVEVSHVEGVSVNGKETQKISMELRNSEDERLPLVLWGGFATDINNAVQVHGEQSLVVVLRFGKIKVWKEKVSVSNAYNVSTVSINPQMVEVETFVNTLPNDELALAIVEAKPTSVVNGVSDKDDLFVHTPRKTIAQVLCSNQTETCIVMCTIAAIDADMGWYYLSCKLCAKKVLPLLIDDDSEDNEIDALGHSKWYCGKCKIENPKLLPRYKLHLNVLDNTGSTKFMLFDNHAYQLLHQPCLELTGPVHEEIQEAEVLPLALTNLVGKTFLFKIGIQREHYVYKHDTYKVLKIMTNQEIINEFEVQNSPQDSIIERGPEFSLVSDAPEGSLMLTGSSQRSKSLSLTPAKRIGTPIINLEDAFDQNSVTRNATSVRIKKEKDEKSG